LLVEDDDVDVMAIKRAFQKLKIANPIFEAGNGIEALEILRGTHSHLRISNPFIILLDLNMPKMGGIEFLEELRKDPVLHSAVVFVLTTSDDEKDRTKAYDKNIAGYILKHRAGQSFLDSVAMLDHYWRIVELPEVKI